MVTGKGAEVAVLAVLLLLPAARAGATAYCEIRQTDDGFVALRAGPSARSEMLEKMRPGDEVLLGQGRVGRWVEVTFWRGGRFASGRNPDGDPATAGGWMREDLIAEDSCG
jgi:hypothetical protein